MGIGYRITAMKVRDDTPVAMEMFETSSDAEAYFKTLTSSGTDNILVGMADDFIVVKEEFCNGTWCEICRRLVRQ